ncbi:MAG: hypothetical protein GWP25_01000 [Euryarchaeota archaeon]|nr:hypothetical protein [Euryarchaeota archaeon]
MQERSGFKIGLAILLTILVASSSYVVSLKLITNDEQEQKEIECEGLQIRTDEGCVEPEPEVPKPEDCTSTEVWRDSICDEMDAPTNLTYGSDIVVWRIGENHTLTPSFDGDGPDTWSVFPAFPSFLVMNSESGELTALLLEEHDTSTHTIIAANDAGVTMTNLTITVINAAPLFHYPNPQWTFISMQYGELPLPVLGGMSIDAWNISPALPEGLIYDQNGRIGGKTSVLGTTTHMVNATNTGGSMEFEIEITVVDEAPSLWYGALGNGDLTLTKGIPMAPLVATSADGAIVNCSSQPSLPSGLVLDSDCSIHGTADGLLVASTFVISAENSGGDAQRNLTITVLDQPLSNVSYGIGDYTFAKQVDVIHLEPSYDGGVPLEWSIEPSLPFGVEFNTSTGEITGTAYLVYPMTVYTIYANNTGGTASTQVSLTFVDTTPSGISYADTELVVESNHSTVNINITNLGETVDTWESHPPLPSGLSFASDGTIYGNPNTRAIRTTFTIYANNSGGSFNLQLNITVHDLDTDWEIITRGVNAVDYGGSWPSLILPFGEWSFPILSDWDQRPIASAAHAGKGRIVGYGHEAFVAQSMGNEMTLSLNAMKWACAEGRVIGLWNDFNHFEDELINAGFTVLTSVSPNQLSGLDCYVGEFWNGWSDAENRDVEEFLTSGHGLILGGHSWYWSYSNSDLAHSYSGNKIAPTTGLFVSSNSGSAQVTIDSTPPHRLLRTLPAVNALEAHFTSGPMITTSDASVVEKTIARSTAMLTLDFTDFWNPLRSMVNTTGWTEIADDNKYDLNADPIADVRLAIEEGLYLRLPADELIAHPSAIDFPGAVPTQAARVTEIVSINGDYIGLPSGFGYAGARSHGMLGTGLYAAAGETVNVTVPASLVDQNVRIQIGAHSDSLWNKEELDRHPKIHRNWVIDSTNMHVGNTFGGLIYITFPPDSTFGMVNVTIENAVEAPRYIAGITTAQEWNTTQRLHPAPWAELEGEFFILTVPSSEIRNLYTVVELMNWWDTALQMEHNLSGYLPWTRVERAVFDIQISAGWMHSGYPFMAHTVSVPDVTNLSQISTQGDWGMFHELGHNHQWMDATLPGNTETTCNLFSAYIMTELVGVDLATGHGAMSSSNRETRTEGYFNTGAQISQWSVWTALETHMQIQEEFGWDVFTRAFEHYYNSSLGQPNNDAQEYNSWAARISNETGTNLVPYFQAWGLPIDAGTFTAVDHLPIWNDDPLRGWVYDYPSLLRGFSSSNLTSSSATVHWENYDNGTEVNQTLCWGLIDGGTVKSAWASCTSQGLANVGLEQVNLASLVSGSTYSWRILGEGPSGDHWTDVQTFTTN